MELLKLLSTSEIIAQVVNFLLLLILMRVFFWKKVLKLLDERRDRISSQLEHIENTKKEIEHPHAPKTSSNRSRRSGAADAVA